MKILRIILWIVISIIFITGLLYLFHGSLEMYPTSEQQEKARVAACVIMFVPLILGAILELVRILFLIVKNNIHSRRK